LMNFICLVPRRFSLGIEISGKTMGARGLMGMEIEREATQKSRIQDGVRCNGQ
jgi:hypothetical protein